MNAPIYDQTVRDRTPLGQVPMDPLRDVDRYAVCVMCGRWRPVLWMDDRDVCAECE